MRQKWEVSEIEGTVAGEILPNEMPRKGTGGTREEEEAAHMRKFSINIAVVAKLVNFFLFAVLVQFLECPVLVL